MAISQLHRDPEELGLAHLARAETVSFDDLDANGGFDYIDNGYAQLDWDNMIVLNPVEAAYTDEYPPDYYQGYINACTSGDQCAVGAGAEPCSVYIADGTFSLDSVNMTAGWDKRLVVDIAGYAKGVEVAHMKVVVNDRVATHIDIGFSKIDQVVFTPIKGVTDPNANSSGDQVAFDDFVFSHIRGTASVQPNSSGGLKHDGGVAPTDSVITSSAAEHGTLLHHAFPLA